MQNNENKKTGVNQKVGERHLYHSRVILAAKFLPKLEVFFPFADFSL